MAAIKHIIFLFFLLPYLLVAQNAEFGLPYSENFTPKQIGVSTNIYSIHQENSGIMYFSNDYGLLSFDGAKWQMIPTNGNPVVYKTKTNQIIVGGYNAISILTYKKGIAVLEPLIKFPENIGQVTRITEYQGVIFFIANKTLYFISNNDAKKIVSDPKHINFFNLTKKFYISLSDGFFEFSSQLFRISDLSNFFANTAITDMFYSNNKLFIRANDMFYTYHNKKLAVFKTQIDNELVKNMYSCAIELSNGDLAIGTKKNGIYIINKQGEFVQSINAETGLHDNSVNTLFVSENNNVWIGYRNGIGRLEIPSAYSFFNKNMHINGIANAFIRHKGVLYVATDIGLYKLDARQDVSPHFIKASNTLFGCKALYTDSVSLIVATDNGLYEYANNTEKLIGAGNFKVIKRHPKTQEIWAATDNMIYIYAKKNGTYIQRKTIGPVLTEIHSIAFGKNNIIWVGTLHKGVIKIIAEKEYTINNYFKGVGFNNDIAGVKVFETRNNVLFASGKYIYTYDYNKNLFVESDIISGLSGINISEIFSIKEDIDNNLWVILKTQGVHRNLVLYCKKNKDGKYVFNVNQIKKISQFICESIYSDKSSIFWFAGYDGIIRLDLNDLYVQNHIKDPILQSVYINGDSLIETSVVKFVPQINYDYNSIRFDFSTPIFENPEFVLHSYILEGEMEEWSTPSRIFSKEFSNLAPGRYVFKVKAYDMYGNESAITSYSFIVLTPFYLQWWAIVLYLIGLALVIYSIYKIRSRYHQQRMSHLEEVIKQKTSEIVLEKDKTERILRNILPEYAAREIKEKGKVDSRRFDLATILFCDVSNFTKIAEINSVKELIEKLDALFLQFDAIIEKYSVEKIKTIGDSYMCVSGLPNKNRANPFEIVMVALEMKMCAQHFRLTLPEHEADMWNVRIGINSGAVIAGVLGKIKYSYDIWGDSVNIASRMESSGEVGKVNISENTYLLIRDYFDCKYRGKVLAKNKGNIDMYFVEGFKEEYASDSTRMYANESFITELALLKLEDIQDRVFAMYDEDRLHDETYRTKKLYYHNAKHTIDVVNQAEIIGKLEGINQEDLLLLKTAALLHDVGFLRPGYCNNHEEESVKIAEAILPEYGYNSEQLETVVNLILATKLPYQPKTLLQQILCDADLDYLGREDYVSVSRDLYLEFVENKIIKKSESNWNQIQIKFLQSHTYFTETSKRRRNQNKQNQLSKLLQQIQ